MLVMEHTIPKLIFSLNEAIAMFHSRLEMSSAVAAGVIAQAEKA